MAQALRDAAAALAEVSDTARLDAEVLMAHVLGASRSDLLLRHMGDAVPAGFAALVARRMAHEPVAYITGQQEFYGRPFAVTHDVLIPRGDSETLVEAALAAAPAPRRVLDCGTGSGALLLSVLAERPVQRIEGHVRTKLGENLADIAIDIDAGDAVALGLEGVGARFPGGKRHRPLGGKATHQDGYMLATHQRPRKSRTTKRTSGAELRWGGAPSFASVRRH